MQEITYCHTYIKQLKRRYSTQCIKQLVWNCYKMETFLLKLGNLNAQLSTLQKVNKYSFLIPTKWFILDQKQWWLVMEVNKDCILCFSIGFHSWILKRCWHQMNSWRGKLTCKQWIKSKNGISRKLLSLAVLIQVSHAHGCYSTVPQCIIKIMPISIAIRYLMHREKLLKTALIAVIVVSNSKILRSKWIKIPKNSSFHLLVNK